MNRVWKMVFWQARDAAKRRNKQWFLSMEDFEELVDRSNGKCEVTGVKFNFEHQVGKRYPYRPTIDRIDSSLPYCLSNCRLTALFVNLGMNQWGDQVFTQLKEQHRNSFARVELGFLLVAVVFFGTLIYITNL